MGQFGSLTWVVQRDSGNILYQRPCLAVVIRCSKEACRGGSYIHVCLYGLSKGLDDYTKLGRTVLSPRWLQFHRGYHVSDIPVMQNKVLVIQFSTEASEDLILIISLELL